MRRAGHVQGRQSIVTANAVFLVHDQVALGDFGRFGDELIGPLPPPRRTGDAFAQKILLADHGQTVRDEAAFDAQSDYGDGTGLFAPDGCPTVLLRRVFEPMLVQKMRQPFPRAPGPGRDDDSPALGRPTFRLRPQLIEHVDPRPAAGLGEDRSWPAAAIDPGGAVGFRKRCEGQTRPEGQHFVPLVAGQIQLASRQCPIRYLPVSWRRFPGLRVVRDHLQSRLQHLVRLVIEADGGVRQIVEKILHDGVEQRHPVLHSRMAPPVGNRQIDRVPRRVRPEQFPPAGAEARDGILVQRQFGDRA